MGFRKQLYDLKTFFSHVHYMTAPISIGAFLLTIGPYYVLYGAAYLSSCKIYPYAFI